MVKKVVTRKNLGKSKRDSMVYCVRVSINSTTMEESMDRGFLFSWIQVLARDYPVVRIEFSSEFDDNGHRVVYIDYNGQMGKAVRG